jgi:hypothetical protein
MPNGTLVGPERLKQAQTSLKQSNHLRSYFLVPNPNFLRDYLTYAADNEAPKMFHVWAALTAVSASVGRRVFLAWGTRAMYCNIYVLLVGDAGNGKSITMVNFKKLFRAIKPELQHSASRESPQGLWQFMTGNLDIKPPIEAGAMELIKWPNGQLLPTHPMLILANEFLNFISMDDKGWINELNDIYDEDMYHYRTKNAGQNKVIGPYITMLGGLTTDVALDMQKAKIISTGLARRVLFQFGSRRFEDPHAFLTETEEQRAAFSRCETHLNLLRKSAGEFQWNDQAKQWFKDWYDNHSQLTPKRSPQTRSWFTSKPDQLLKIAMVLSLCESVDFNLTVQNFREAAEFLEVLERDLYRIFGGVGRNETAGVAMQVFEYIAGLTEPISKKQLWIKMFNFLSPKDARKEFDEVLSYLAETKKIQIHGLIVTTKSGSFTDPIIATPEVLQAWAARNLVALSATQADVVQAEIDRGSLPQAGPSVAPVPTLTFLLPPSAPQVAPQSANENASDQPQKPNPE